MNAEMLELFKINKELAIKVLYNIHSSVADKFIKDITSVSKNKQKKGSSLLDSIENDDGVDKSASSNKEVELANEFLNKLNEYTFVNNKKISKISFLSFKATFQEIQKRPMLLKALEYCIEEMDKIDNPVNLGVENFDIEERELIREQFPKLQFELDIMIRNKGSYLDIDKRLKDSRIRNDLLLDYKKVGYNIMFKRLKGKEKPVWRKL